MTEDRVPTTPSDEEVTAALHRVLCQNATHRSRFTGLCRSGPNIARVLRAGTGQPVPPLDVLTPYERNTLDQHTDDGNGGCMVCRIWTVGEYDDDGETPLTSIVAWPCPMLRLSAQPAPPLDVERLAEAMNNVRPYGGNPSAWAKVAAQQIAAEYERLARDD